MSCEIVEKNMVASWIVYSSVHEAMTKYKWFDGNYIYNYRLNTKKPDASPCAHL